MNTSEIPSPDIKHAKRRPIEKRNKTYDLAKCIRFDYVRFNTWGPEDIPRFLDSEHGLLLVIINRAWTCIGVK